MPDEKQKFLNNKNGTSVFYPAEVYSVRRKGGFMSDYFCKKNKWFYLGLTVPSMLLYFLALAGPLIFGTFPASFYNWNLIKGNKDFVGLGNFVKLLQDQTFLHSVAFTLILAAASILMSNLLGFVVAYFLDSNIRGKGVIRSLFFIPNIISGVMVAFVWSFIFTGAIPNLAEIFHIDALANISWFGKAGTAAFTVILVTTWQSAGFLMMLYVAGLQTIPKELLEAAVLDGCTGFKKIIYIQLPMLMPTITINLFVSIAGAFKAFDIPISLTGGGPANSTQTMAMNIYNDAFGAFKLGYGSAKSVILFLLVGVIALIQLRLTRKREVQM